ncbi:MAG: TolC family protein [Nibricoccus sp.]
MNVLHRSAFLLTVAALISTPSRAALSLADAFGEMEKANPTVLISREAVAQALAVAEQQRAGLMPKVSLDVQQRRTQTVQLVSDLPIAQSPIDRFDGKLTGSVPLVNLSVNSAYRAARKGAVVAQLDEQQTLQSVLKRGGAGLFRTHAQRAAHRRPRRQYQARP